jgi:hypothetical protein
MSNLLIAMKGGPMAKNILSAAVTIEGVRPFLWHFFGPDAIPLEKGEKTGVPGNDPESWKRTVLASPDDKRKLYILPTYVFGCVRDGSRHTKLGRGSLQPKVVATLQITDTLIYFDRTLPREDKLKLNDYTAPVYIDQRAVRNPKTRGANICYRVAASAPWTLTFHLQWDKTVVSRDQMASVLNDSGAYEGLGSGRKIGMGRFVVKKFEVSEAPSNGKTG